MNQLTQRDLELHVPLIGWLFVIGHALFLLIGVFIFVLLASIGAVTHDPQAMTILSVVGTAVGLLLALLALPGMLAGYGLITHRAWARVLGLVVAILSLLNIPVGTLIGAYAIWVLMQDAANDYFALLPPVQRGEPGSPVQPVGA